MDTITATAIERLKHGRYVWWVLGAIGVLCALGLAPPALAAMPETPSNEEARSVSGTTATLLGVLNATEPGEAGTYEFLYNEGGECEGGAATAVTAATGVAPELVSTTVSKLLPGTEYTFCLRATNTAEEVATGAHLSFTTTAVGQEDSPTVTATEATLTAEIGPDGGETTYELQHGVGNDVEEVSTPKPAATISASSAPVVVQQVLTALKPGRTYSFRFVANNGHGPVDGEERTFTTPAVAIPPTETCSNAQLRAEEPYGLTLPECRAYELVSPSDTNGYSATEPALPVSRASESGGEAALVFPSLGTFGGQASAPGYNELRSRRGSSGWSTQSIDPPEYASNAVEHEWGPFNAMAFTPTLSAGVAESDVPADEPQAPAGYFEQYLLDFATGSEQWVSLGAPVDQVEYGFHEPELMTVMGASTGLERIVYAKGPASTYEWIDGTAVRVDVANKDEEPIGGVAGTGPKADDPYADAWHAVSANGERVFFTSTAQHTLYLRENVGEKQSNVEGSGASEHCTDPNEACTLEIAEEGRFWGANVEGTKVFYTKNGDLYRYELPIGAIAGTTTDLTPGGEVQGVAEIAENGSYVYFVANGVLTSTHNEHGEVARQGTCTPKGSTGECNLYVYHEGGAPMFIATLSGGDREDWARDQELQYTSPATTTAAISPEGNLLAFESGRRLTGYDNEQAQPGECERAGNEELTESGQCHEVFLYDAETGSLNCASCNPTGARPIGAARLNTQSGLQFVEYKPRNLLADGTLFFDSGDALVTGDSNGREDVYEYREGHVDPISDVAGDFESFFLDADPSGQDIYFATADRLVGQDYGNNRVAVYDAREDGGFPAPLAAPACSNGDSCKPPVSPQPAIYGAPSSATFSGPGNSTPIVASTVTPKKKTAAELRAEKLAKALKVCDKDKKKSKRAKCQKQARSKYGATKKAKKSSKDRRAQS